MHERGFTADDGAARRVRWPGRRTLSWAVLTALAATMVMAAAPPTVRAADAATVAPRHPGLLTVRTLTAAGGDALEAVAGVLDVDPVAETDDGMLARWRYVRVVPGTEAAVARRLRALPVVVAVGRPRLRVPAYEPDDPLLGQQSYLREAGLTRAWDVQRGASGVRIGVLDTGFEASNPDLRDVLTDVSGRRGIERVESGCPPGDEFADHGTSTAGLAGASSDDGIGVAGAAFRTSVVAVQLGVSAGGRCLISGRWPSALVALADAGVDVVGMSFAGTTADDFERDAIRYARQRGVTLVAAAGNRGSTAPAYPAAYDGVLGVAALEADGSLVAASSRGDWVDLGAPGRRLMTTCGIGHCLMTGTSMATAMVAGAAALVRDHVPFDRGLPAEARLLDAAGPGPSAAGGRSLRVDTIFADGTVRVAGVDRYGTATRVSALALPGVADRVVLIPGDTADGTGWTYGLPAQVFAADRRTAVLLTPRSHLPPRVDEALRRALAPGGTVVLVGPPTTSISRALERQLRERYAVTRVAGAGPLGTATAIAGAATSDPGAALIARVDVPADAVAMSAVAAAHGFPLLFVTPQGVPPATCAWLREHEAVRTIHVAGGARAVSDSTVEELKDCDTLSGLLVPRTVHRHAGRGRVETALAIARAFFGPRLPERVAIANAHRWPDAVVGGSLGPQLGAPVLLTPADHLPETLGRSLRDGPRTAVLLGGVAVLGADVDRAVVRALR